MVVPQLTLPRRDPSKGTYSLKDDSQTQQQTSLTAVSIVSGDTFRDEIRRSLTQDRLVGGSPAPLGTDTGSLDTLLREFDKAAPLLDRNRDKQITSGEVHAYLMTLVRDELANSELNTGTPEAPRYPSHVSSLLTHLQERSPYLLPILEEQRAFNTALGAYTRILKAFDTVFPGGFNHREVMLAMDGVDGSPRDGKLSDAEFLALMSQNPEKTVKVSKLLGAAIVKAASAAEGVTTYILRRPNVIAQVEEKAGITRAKLEICRNLAREFRTFVSGATQDTPDNWAKRVNGLAEQLAASD
jgi:hypothetical protein